MSKLDVGVKLQFDGREEAFDAMTTMIDQWGALFDRTFTETTVFQIGFRGLPTEVYGWEEGIFMNLGNLRYFVCADSRKEHSRTFSLVGTLWKTMTQKGDNYSKSKFSIGRTT